MTSSLKVEMERFDWTKEMKFFSPQVITVKKIRIILGSKTNLNIQKRTNIRYIAAYPRQTIQWQHMRLYFVEILEISFFFFLTKDCHGSTATVEVTQTFILLSSLVPPLTLDPHGGVYFYNYHGSLNRVRICSGNVWLLH